ncbi:helix-turn-helix domain-containing protein [Vibrio sp. JZG10]|jgi:AraC family transcriptional regulator
MRVDYHQRLVPVIRYLEQHFNDPLNLLEVAALANLSPYHFHRTFKAVQGETLADFIRRLRLEAAADDLFKSKQPVLNIALEDTEVPKGIELQDFPGGQYAVMRQQITEFSQYPKAWDDLMSKVVESGIENDCRPCFELYHSYDPQTHHADVSFCTAIK